MYIYTSTHANNQPNKKTDLELVPHGGVALEPCLPEVQALALVVHPHLVEWLIGVVWDG